MSIVFLWPHWTVALQSFPSAYKIMMQTHSRLCWWIKVSEHPKQHWGEATLLMMARPWMGEPSALIGYVKVKCLSDSCGLTIWLFIRLYHNKTSWSVFICPYSVSGKQWVDALQVHHSLLIKMCKTFLKANQRFLLYGFLRYTPG